MIPLALTHRILGQLVGARRPTVSTALSELAERDELVRRPDGSWLLRGDPPDASTLERSATRHARVGDLLRPARALHPRAVVAAVARRRLTPHGPRRRDPVAFPGMADTAPQERVGELADRIVALRDAYYRGAPLVADAEYDAIEDELRALLDEHPDLTPDPNPLEQVGAPAVLHAPVRHARPMLSLEKATKPEQVAAFFDRFPGQPVAVMPKLDGLSLSVVYERGRLARAVTRGDGTTGDDVTPLARALADGIPDAIPVDDGRIEVRGELVMLRSTFAAYNKAHPDKPLINPRNAAAGTIRAKDPAQVAERRLRFFAFDLDAGDAADDDLERGAEGPRLRRRRRAPHHQRRGGAGRDLRHRGGARPARLRPRRRRAAPRRPQRLRRRRHARRTRPAARSPSSTPPRSARRSSPTSSGTSARSARSRRSPCSSPCSSAARR